MVVEGLFVRWFLWSLSFPLFYLVLRFQTRNHKLCLNSHLFWIYAYGVHHFLLGHWLDWILCLPVVCEKDLRCDQSGLEGNSRIAPVERWGENTSSISDYL